MTRHSCHVRLAVCLAVPGLLALAGAVARASVPADDLRLAVAVGALAPDDSANPDASWRHNGVGLVMHPIGFSLHNTGPKFLDTVVHMHPIGFPARHYTLYPGLSWGLGHATEVAATVMGAKLEGTSAEPIFYGLGIQKQILGDPRGNPRSWSVSVGGYGYTGNRYSGGAGYVAGSSLLAGRRDASGAIYGHAGLEVETFSNSRSDTGVRPFVGASWVVVHHRLTLNGEIASKQSWEDTPPFAVMAVFPVYQNYTLSFGVRSDGFQTFFSGPF